MRRAALFAELGREDFDWILAPSTPSDELLLMMALAAAGAHSGGDGNRGPWATG